MYAVKASFVPLNVPEAVTWKDYTGVIVIGSRIMKTAVDGFGNAGASSVEQLGAGKDGWIEWTVTDGPAELQVGLSEVNLNHSFGTGDYLVFNHRDKYVRVYEKKSFKKKIRLYLCPWRCL